MKIAKNIIVTAGVLIVFYFLGFISAIGFIAFG